MVGNFVLKLEELEYVGTKLKRPESILAEKDGTLWISDPRGLATRRKPDGSQQLLGTVGGLPNGLAMDSNGNLYCANIGKGAVYQMNKRGLTQVFLDSIDGMPLGCPNFVFIDSRDRLWISCSTRKANWFDAISPPINDGYIILVDQNGARIVADGLFFTNEVRLDAAEKYLYAAETTKARVVRYPVLDDAGNLGSAEVFGPESLGFGAYIDGFSFDVEGNIWLTTVFRNGLMIIKPDGSYHTVFEEVLEPELERLVSNLEAGTLTEQQMLACQGLYLQFPTSITFYGADLKTVLIGSLNMGKLVTFRSPVAGLPMSHWLHIKR